MKRLILFLIVAVTFPTPLLAQTPVVHFTFNNTTSDQNTTEAVSAVSYPITNHFNRPEFITGINGNALRMDGWSTYLSAASFSIPLVSRQLSIETWYATEAFTNQPSAIFDLTGTADGVYLAIGPYGEVIFGYFVDGTTYVHTTPAHLTKYEWHHIVATLDLDAHATKIYVDNTLWFSKTDLNGSAISLTSRPLLIGKRNLNQQFGQFSINTINGAIDDISIYNTALDASTVASRFSVAGDRTVALVIDPKVRYAGDYLRPQYHPMPNAVWANECYGLIYFNNKYHLFFQKNPNGPYLYFMHWGHLTSDDLVNWKEERIALAPDATPGFDNFGEWSGTATIGPDGKPAILYTGVNTQRAAIGLATPDDDNLISWSKSPNNPVVAGAPGGTMDFRDTYVWNDGTSYYMIVGSGYSGNLGGEVLYYKSADLKTWSALGTFFSDPNTDRSGIFWEMPFFFKISAETYMLGVNPVPTQTSKAVTLYWLGTWQNGKFKPYDVNPKHLEFIPENMLAPAFGRDKDNNPTVVGIIPEDRSEADQVAAGWRQTFSIAREARLLEDSTVAEIPHRNLCTLRGATVNIQDRIVKSGTNFNLPEFGGNQIELGFTIKSDSASVFSIQVFKNPDAKEFTTIKFDRTANQITLDKKFSTFSNTVVNSRTEKFVFNSNDTTYVRVFLDHSTLEIFVDDLIVISTRVYPSRIEDDKVDLVVASGNARILRADQWTMASLGQNTSLKVCVPENLPTAFHKKKSPSVVTGLGEKEETDIQIYPNPASDDISITSNASSFEIQLMTITGQSVLHQQVSGKSGTVSVRQLNSGIYIGQVVIGKSVKYFKILIQH